MKVSELLIRRLKKDFGIEVNSLKSLHTGIHQKSGGACSWIAEVSLVTYGSQWTMKECVLADKLELLYNANGLVEILVYSNHKNKVN